MANSQSIKFSVNRYRYHTKTVLPGFIFISRLFLLSLCLLPDVRESVVAGCKNRYKNIKVLLVVGGRAKASLRVGGAKKSAIKNIRTQLKKPESNRV
ncbi:hypothetical protein O9992_16885 [Vibrio lentus]|nr:hypothetical protein [Vibrio lentus]